MKRRAFIKTSAATALGVGLAGGVALGKRTTKTFAGSVIDHMGDPLKEPVYVGIQSMTNPKNIYTVKVDENGDWSAEVEVHDENEFFIVCNVSETGYVTNGPVLVGVKEDVSKVKWPGDLL